MALFLQFLGFGLVGWFVYGGYRHLLKLSFKYKTFEHGFKLGFCVPIHY